MNGKSNCEMFNEAAYPGMTCTDARWINEQNAENGYGLTDRQLMDLIQAHKKARNEGDIRTMSKIEYRLTDINFHHVCNLLTNGKYDEAEHELMAW